MTEEKEKKQEVNTVIKSYEEGFLVSYNEQTGTIKLKIHGGNIVSYNPDKVLYELKKEKILNLLQNVISTDVIVSLNTDYNYVMVKTDEDQIKKKIDVLDKKKEETKKAEDTAKKIVKETSKPVNSFSGVKKEQKKESVCCQETDNKNYFKNLSNIKAEIEKKNGLSYISWADAWTKLKEVYPESTYEIHLSSNDTPLFKAGTGGMVKVTVNVKGVDHTIMLPVLDFKNKSINYEQIDSFQINKTIMRALAKGIAMHGCCTYVYRGEDFPNEGD